MKTLNPHPHVIKLLGCITESGKLSKINWLAFHFTGLYLHYGIKSGSTVSVFDKFLLLNSAMVLVFLSPTQINTDGFLHVLNHIIYEIWTFQAIPFWLYITSLWERKTYISFYQEPLWVLIEYVPYGDLLGYLRKSRGLNDTYYNDPDIKPRTSLMPQQLMKFAWQIADGMSYLSKRSVS